MIWEKQSIQKNLLERMSEHQKLDLLHVFVVVF